MTAGLRPSYRLRSVPGLAGNMQPLVRLLGVELQIISVVGSPDVDLAVSVATQCADGSFFW